MSDLCCLLCVINAAIVPDLQLNDDTYFNAKCRRVFVLPEFHVADDELNVAARSVEVHEELVEIFLQWQHDQLMHHALQDLIQVEEFVGL